MRSTAAMLFLAADVQSLLLPTTRSVRTVGTPRMGLLPEGSLGGKMLKTVTDLFDNGDEAEAAPAPESEGDTPKGSRLLSDDAVSGRNSALEDAVSDIDSRAADGDITFRDFLTMSKTISGMGEDMSALPPGLSATQILELRAKVTKHEKIVEARHARSPGAPEPRSPGAPRARTHWRDARTHACTHARTHAARTNSPPRTPGDDGGREGRPRAADGGPQGRRPRARPAHAATGHGVGRDGAGGGSLPHAVRGAPPLASTLALTLTPTLEHTPHRVPLTPHPSGDA